MQQLTINILVNTTIYLLVSCSIGLIYSVAKFFNLTHAAILTLGAYLSYSICYDLSYPKWVALVLAVCGVLVLSLMLLYIVIVPLQKKQVKGWQMMIASLGLYTILQNIISLIWGDDTNLYPLIEIGKVYSLGSAYVTTIQIITFVTCLLLFCCLCVFIYYTSWGRAIRAMSSNRELSTIFGISEIKVEILSFLIGSLLVSVAGILIAMDEGLSPTMGFNKLLFAIMAMIIGGQGHLIYYGLGAFVLAFIQEMAAYLIAPMWAETISYIILIAFLYFQPYGISRKQNPKTEV